MKFFDIPEQMKPIQKDVLHRIDHLLRKGDYVLGEAVREFEHRFAQFCGVRYAVGVNSGTDALFLSLKALGIKKGDEVIVPAFSFIATAFVVYCVGAKPIFVDIDESTYNLDPQKLARAITKRTKAIIPVHLFGLCADVPSIKKIASHFRVPIVEDAAQAHGAKIGNRFAGSFGITGCFSFYPTKNLGAAGDGGMITTDSKQIYRMLLSLRDCGRGKKRYLHPRLGYNSRLDSIQALILTEKLRLLPGWINTRSCHAVQYVKELKGCSGISFQQVPENYRHAYHIFPFLVKHRTRLIRALEARKIPYAIFYPLPLHLQRACRNLGYKKGGFPAAEYVANHIMALPIHPHLKKTDIINFGRIIRGVCNE